MKVIVAGSRDYCDPTWVSFAIADSGFQLTELVHGDCDGVDRTAAALYKEKAESGEITIAPFPAQWSIFGNEAGPIRNHQMAQYADVLVLIWDGPRAKKKSGSRLMLKFMKDEGKPIKEYHIQPDGTLKPVNQSGGVFTLTLQQLNQLAAATAKRPLPDWDDDDDWTDDSTDDDFSHLLPKDWE